MKNISIFCWNIANPSLERALKQSEWLAKRPEDVFILTETKNSKGCLFLERYFQIRGYHVIFPMPTEREYGVMVISKIPMAKSVFLDYINFLPARVIAVNVPMSVGMLEIIGVYVPSRDDSAKKIKRKKHFLSNIDLALKSAPKSVWRIFCGDFNILEPNHIPRYPFFKKWEYDFYTNLIIYQLEDAFRRLNQSLLEYSWVGRTGDGYRYDHLFVSKNIISAVETCLYVHEPRKARLSDHSAIVTRLNFED